jgi:hypothetical protein
MAADTPSSRPHGCGRCLLPAARLRTLLPPDRLRAAGTPPSRQHGCGPCLLPAAWLRTLLPPGRMAAGTASSRPPQGRGHCLLPAARLRALLSPGRLAADIASSWPPQGRGHCFLPAARLRALLSPGRLAADVASSRLHGCGHCFLPAASGPRALLPPGRIAAGPASSRPPGHSTAADTAPTWAHARTRASPVWIRANYTSLPPHRLGPPTGRNLIPASRYVRALLLTCLAATSLLRHSDITGLWPRCPDMHPSLFVVTTRLYHPPAFICTRLTPPNPTYPALRRHPR